MRRCWGADAIQITGVAYAGASPFSRKHGQTGLDRPMPSRLSRMTNNTQNQRRCPAPPYLRRART